MIDPSRVLLPLDEAEAAVRTLHGYRGTDELAAALQTVAAAIEHTLRLLLRADVRAPEALRLSALAPDALPPAEVVDALRSSDLLSIDLAGAIHQTRAAAERAAAGDVRASDADAALHAVHSLRDAVRAAAAAPPAAAGGSGGAAAGPGGAAAATSSAEPTAAGGSGPGTAGEPAAAGGAAVPASLRAGTRARGLWLLGAVALIAIVAMVLLARRSSATERGIAAFADGRMAAAEQQFERAVQDDSTDITARLYLARIFRRQQRYADAVGQLRIAAALAPDDADVRRELGNFFFERHRYDAAAEQYQRALELDPSTNLNWIGLIRALRAAGDPRSAEILQNAPAEVRATLGQP